MKLYVNWFHFLSKFDSIRILVPFFEKWARGGPVVGPWCGGTARAVAGGAKGGVIPSFKRRDLKVGGFPTLRGYRRPLLGLRAIFSQRSLLVAQLIRSAAFSPFANAHTLGGAPSPPPPSPPPRKPPHPRPQGGQGPKGPRGQRDQRALRALWAKGPFGPREGAFGALGAHGAVGMISKLFRMDTYSEEVAIGNVCVAVGRSHPKLVWTACAQNDGK